MLLGDASISVASQRRRTLRTGGTRARRRVVALRERNAAHARLVSGGQDSKVTGRREALLQVDDVSEDLRFMAEFGQA